MALDGSVQRKGCLITEILPAIEGQFHQKIVGVCFGAGVRRFLGIHHSLDGRFKYCKVRPEFIFGKLLFGSIGEVFSKGAVEMMVKSCSVLRSKLSHRQGRKQGKY